MFTEINTVCLGGHFSEHTVLQKFQTSVSKTMPNMF